MSSFEQPSLPSLDTPLRIPLRRAKNSLHERMQLYLQSHSEYPLILERRFPEIKRIADLVLEEKRLVIEIQTSLIDPVEALKRIDDYTQLGYKVRWLLYKPLFYRQPFPLISRLLGANQALLFSYHTEEFFLFEDFNLNEIPLKQLFESPY